MIGKTILHYKILEKLGEGGMGVVYKAEDTKLDRTVAIKFLPRSIAASDEDKKRFIIEAKAAAALNHPNIATIYAIEESEDSHGDREMFIVMEYIEGWELKELIGEIPPIKDSEKLKNQFSSPVQKGGKKEFPLPDVIAIATQIAEGLKAAHEKGIIHRDIKSSNIMITPEGRVKIMDFGLAKLGMISPITKEHTALGTTAYMSPEQIRGENADQRSDIWAFGVILYEMLTGIRPFRGEYEQAVMYSILNEEPESVFKLNHEVPSGLEQIVDKALKKDLLSRYQEFSEILKDITVIEISPLNQPKPIIFHRFISEHIKPVLIVSVILTVIVSLFIASLLINKNSNKKLSSSKGKSHLERLAVLPFVNLRSDPRTNFLGYALADQIIGALTYVKNITVRPSTIVRKYENTVPDISEVGNNLKVDYILAGNYLKQGNTIRLNVELVNISSDELVWREPIVLTYENVFTLQDIVSREVIKGLKLQFTPAETERIGSNVPQNSTAYEYYLKAISYPYTTQSNQMAVDTLKKSVDLDSTFAPAYAELGNRYHMLASYKFGGENQIRLAEKYVRKALTLNPDLLNALGTLTTIYTELSRTDEAVGIARRMLEINPNNPVAHFSLGYIYRYVGMLNESKKECDIALSLDPRKAFRSAGITYLQVDKYKQAIQAFDLDKASSFSLCWKGEVYLRENKPERALHYLNKVISSDPNSVWGYNASAMKAYLDEEDNQGIRWLRKWEKTTPVDGEAWYGIADLYALFGKKNDCIRSLRKAVDNGYFNYSFMVKDIFLNSVRNDSEFQHVLKQTKEKHENFESSFFPVDQ